MMTAWLVLHVTYITERCFLVIAVTLQSVGELRSSAWPDWGSLRFGSMYERGCVSRMAVPCLV